MKLLVVSQAPHYTDESGAVFGWGPMVEELTALSQLFEEIVHVAWFHRGAPPAVAQPYPPGIRAHLVPGSGGPLFMNKLGIIWQIPKYLRAIVQQIKDVDAVHARCPSSIGFLCLLTLSLQRRPKVRWAKFAGNWGGRENEPVSYRVQRQMLARGLHRGPVTVNGRKPRDPAHVLSFHNPSINPGDLDEIAALPARRLTSPYKLLFVGRIEAAKGVPQCLEALAALLKDGHAVSLDVAGDGPDRAALELMAEEKGVSQNITFHGWVGRDRLRELYSSAHFLVLPSRSEGWPKVASEAMAWGAVPIVTAVSTVASVLGEAGGGTAIPSNTAAALAQALFAYLSDPSRWEQESISCRRVAHWFTYDRYVAEIDRMLARFFDEYELAEVNQ